LFYIDTDGELRHRERPVTLMTSTNKRWNKRFANQIAGCLDKGYRRVEIRLPGESKGRLYAVHQVVWAMEHGAWADCHLDHRDGNGIHNSPSNLRRANFTQNNADRRAPTVNTSGANGVTLDKRNGKWCARIGRQRLGSFEKFEDAVTAYNRGAERWYGEFARAA
jgi:hypothetical protein